MGLLHQKNGGGDNNCNDNLISSADSTGDADVIYYGVYIPNIKCELDNDGIRVFKTREEALNALKANNMARFKAFTSEADAIQFSINGHETVIKFDCPNLPASPTVAHVESSGFKGPVSQDLVKFRKAIEKHNLVYVKQCIQNNPRYLVSSGDTPQILQEGSRYNALHVAARSNNAIIAKFICETVRSIEFMTKLYGGAKSNLTDRGSIMLDLYLNTPDKAANETPLHFASKLGALEVVRVLVAYDKCDRNRRNKFGETARDLVCSRANGAVSDVGIKKDILFALEDHYYVAVLRSPDNAMAPTIPEPFSPTSPPPFLDETPKKKTELLTPMMVSGVAGPMTASEATTFRKKWKTPPRKLVYDTSTISPIKTDPEKGFERVGRALASDLKIQWKEYWAFLGEFIDLTSTDGLQKLETHLKNVIGSRSAKTTPQKPPQQTTCSPLQSIVSPITDLCNNFKMLALQDQRPKVSPHCIDNSSAVFATRLALSLSRGLMSSIQEIEKFQYFLEGCSKDSRFSQEDLTTAHSRLASHVYSRLKRSSSDSGCNEIADSILDEKTDNCSLRFFQCLKCVLNFVKENAKGICLVVNCDCPIRAKSECQNRAGVIRSVGNEDDDTDEDDISEFFTPPTSPIPFDEDDEFVIATGTTEVYIEGGANPTKLDFDVHRTVADVVPNLSPSKYPYIYYWSRSISKQLPKPPK